MSKSAKHKTKKRKIEHNELADVNETAGHTQMESQNKACNW